MLELLSVLLNIKIYINYLINFIQQLMNLTVLLIKLFRKYVCS